MNVNAPTASEEGKSEGFSGKMKRTYVIGVVDTTGMKSVIANRKRRWDQPPDEEGDNVPPKVVVREVEGDITQPEPDQPGMLCEGEQGITEDYDSQYDECVGSNNVVPGNSLEEPIPKDVPAIPASDGRPITKCVEDSEIDSQSESLKEHSSVADVPPDDPPPLPSLECPTTSSEEIEGSSDHRNFSNANAKDKDSENHESEKDTKTEVKVVEKKVVKLVEAVPVTGIISDSLKQIQFCYDEGSNSTEGSDTETKIEEAKPGEAILAKEDDDIIEDHQSEQTATADLRVIPSEVKDGFESLKDTRRSPTPVLNEELDENSLSEVEIAQNEQIAIVESKTDTDEVNVPHLATTMIEEVHDNKFTSADVESISGVENSATKVSKLNLGKNVVDSVDAAGTDEQTKIASSLCEPVEESTLELEVHCDGIQSSQKQLLKDQISSVDVKTTPVMQPPNEVSAEILEVSPELLTEKVSQVEADVLCREISSKPSESLQPNHEARSEEPLGAVAAGKEMGKIDATDNGKPFTDSVERKYSEPSLSKEMKMFMEEPSEKYTGLARDELPGKEGGKVGQTNIISMDNSQNCVGFDDLSSLEKVAPKSPELDLRYSDSEEESKEDISSEVTMHFASFRTPENATNTKPERDIEDAKDESAKAIDALVSANPDLSDKPVELQEPENSMGGNTMEMIDSLGRRSPEDEPSGIRFGEGMLSERDTEEAKDESAKAIDTIVSADLSGKQVELQDAACTMDGNTMEMLDSLVMSSEDDPSRIRLGDEMLSERDIEDAKDESAKAIDALIESANPDLSDRPVEIQDPASTMDGNTMEMLDSLVLSSEDTPSQIRLGDEMLSERDIEDAKDESATVIDALIVSANPDLSDRPVEIQAPASPTDGNTMEMLDSLVRRSSEDDPSRIRLGEGMLSEDSLINEINQLPDNDDKKIEVHKSPEYSSEPVVESTSPDSKEGVESTSADAVETLDDEPKESSVEVNTDVSENVSTTVTADLCNSEKTVDISGEITGKTGIKRDTEKSEAGTSVEDELSQGGEEEPKTVNVSNENILEVIFGSKQENSIHTIRSMENDVDSKGSPKNNKGEKHIGDSSVNAIEPKISSYSNKGQKSADDSKLQLNNEEIEIDNTEIVMVDPTKPLSGEDTDNDADDGCSDKGGSTNKKAEVSSTVSSEIDVADESAPQSNSSIELAVQSVLNKEVDVAKEPVVEVGESNSPDTHGSETCEAEAVVSEPMDVDEKTESPPVVCVDNSAVTKTKKDTKGTPVLEPSHITEPAVPVLIIKKQAVPSKKDGDKKVVETLLTCSPKSTDNFVSDSASFPSKKLHNEGLQIETAQESSAGSYSPKHSPITLRIYKDNLTVKTDLDSPKRNKSPMSSEFKSELSPKLRSPSVSENLPAQNKQLEFTLKIAKDVHTNYPKATMSPKNVSSPTSVWKSEVQIADSSTVSNKDIENVQIDTPSLPTRGRGRGRGRGATPKRGIGRGRRGAPRGRISSAAGETPKTSLGTTEASSSSLGVDVVIKQEVLTEDEKSEGSSVGAPLTIQMHDMFKKINKEAEGSAIRKKSIHSEGKTLSVVEAQTPVPRKRGRPRKSVLTPIVVPEEVVMVKQEPSTALDITPPLLDGAEGDDGSSSTGRPKRTCRGRTKPIVVKKRKPRGGGAAGVPRGASTPLPSTLLPLTPLPSTPLPSTPLPSTPLPSTTLPLVEIKQENATTPLTSSVTTEATTPESSTLPTVTPSPPVDKSGVTPTPPARGRGGFKRPTPDRNTLSEKELAELQKIEAKKEKLRLDRIAKYEAKKAKKLAKKLKDEERRKRLAREKAEKAEAAAPQVFEEETRMSAPDCSSRGHTPAPNRILTSDGLMDESQNSISTPGDTNKGNKKGRMEISITDMDCLVKEVRVDELAEYQWQGSELFMIQEQVSLYLGVKSFKRKYPGLKRRPVEAEERTFLEDSGLVPKSMCDLGLTAVGSAEILDILFQDFPEKYEEFRKHVRDKQAREASFKQKAAIGLQKKDGTKVEPREQALEAVAAWNANLNRERREERRCALDLQTFTVHYPKLDRDNMKKSVPKVGLYPVAVIPGQFCDHYKKYTPNELMYFPVNTVLYGPLRPNERQKDTGSDDGSGSESSSSSSSSSSSGESSSESESEGEEPAKCKMCSGTKKKNKDSIPEVLLTCVHCKSCYHPTCKEFTPEMIVHLTKYEWQCTACKQCSKCRDPNLKDRIMCCQLCDRGYHLSCIGLKKMPEGRWHCTVCAYCSSCSSRNPGGSDWQHEFKKGEKGIKIYQRTLCTPCFKLWRKGKYCQLCSKCHSMKPEEDPSLIQCNSCDRWLHKECYGSKYGLTNNLMSTSSIQCDFCVERVTLGSHGVNRSLIKV